MNLDESVREMEKEQRISIVKTCKAMGKASAVFDWFKMLEETIPLRTHRLAQHKN